MTKRNSTISVSYTSSFHLQKKRCSTDKCSDKYMESQFVPHVLYYNNVLFLKSCSFSFSPVDHYTHHTQNSIQIIHHKFQLEEAKSLLGSSSVLSISTYFIREQIPTSSKKLMMTLFGFLLSGIKRQRTRWSMTACRTRGIASM